MDKDGHIMHIDFGFLLSSAPGKGIKFEQAPFKMTDEYVDCLGGAKSDAFPGQKKLSQGGCPNLGPREARVAPGGAWGAPSWTLGGP